MSDEVTTDGMTIEIPCDKKGEPFLPGDHISGMFQTVIGYTRHEGRTKLLCADTGDYVAIVDPEREFKVKDSLSSVLSDVHMGMRVDWAELRMKRIMEAAKNAGE